MNNLSRVYFFKIFATIIFWCIPLLFFPKEWLQSFGFPKQETYMFVRMLGWAYLALCVGYFNGLLASLKGIKLKGPIYVGLVSNGGACLYLSYYAVLGTWNNWGSAIQFIGWSSIIATFLITLGLFVFGMLGTDEN